MQSTGKSHGDGVLAATLALAVNGLIAWQLPVLLAPQHTGMRDAAVAALDVAWIAAVPHRDPPLAAPVKEQTAMARAARVTGRPRQVRAIARPEPAAIATPADLLPARPLSAVFLQQAGEWARNHPLAAEPIDPFANGRVALAEQAASRFRLKPPNSVAGAVARIGRLVGGPGYTTDDCELIRGRLVGLVAGGDLQAAQQDLDYARRHCRP